MTPSVRFTKLYPILLLVLFTALFIGSIAILAKCGSLLGEINSKISSSQIIVLPKGENSPSSWRFKTKPVYNDFIKPSEYFKNLVYNSNEKAKSCSDTPRIADAEKLDCYPELQSVSEKQCLSRGCCWKSVEVQPNPSNLSTPFCFFPHNYQGYVVENLIKTQSEIHAVLNRKQPSGFPNDIQKAVVTVTFIDDLTVRIKILDQSSPRYEVPYPSIPNIKAGRLDSPSQAYNVMFDVDGNLRITRKSTGTTLFDTKLSQLVFSDQFLQFSTSLPSKYVYGLGEHMEGLPRSVDWNRITLFNRDWEETFPNKNLYGSHPFYLVMEEDANSHGVFLLNSNAMDVILQPAPTITFRPIGGIFDFLVFLGPQPSDVIKQYISMIGLPSLPPYWSLGFHLCRFGYNTMEGTREVWKRTREAEIPFDVQWNDIDYMDKRNDFTYDHKAFKDFSKFIQEVHDAGMHYVLMFDPGVSASEPSGTYLPYEDGLAMDIFVKNSTGDGIFLGKVWNTGSTVFPDFLNPKAVDYWVKQFQRFYNEIKFDGAWIDMNEPSNIFGVVEDCPSNSPFENPPYVPGNSPLSLKTICMSAKHYNGMLHYDVHNIYGFMEAIATNIALRALHKRPFIISRATFPGQGRYSGHWDGDVRSDWENLRWSVPSILNFNMFGIPMVGADICGFHGNTTIELCSRWFELGAFYPFSRNHNEHIPIPQDPVALGPEVISAAKNSLNIRYYLLPYLYSLFFQSSLDGETVARPLFFEFPTDKETYSIFTQFLWGPGLMIIPTLEEGARKVEAYFPEGVWYDYHTKKPRQSKGEKYTLDSPLDTINLDIRGGYILPAQDASLTTTESRKNNFHLLVALDSNGYAEGTLYWDDGESLDTESKSEFNTINFNGTRNSVSSVCVFKGYETTMILDKVVVMGVEAKPTTVIVNGQKSSKPIDYSSESKTLEISSLQKDFLKDILITWN